MSPNKVWIVETQSYGTTHQQAVVATREDAINIQDFLIKELPLFYRNEGVFCKEVAVLSYEEWQAQYDRNKCEREVVAREREMLAQKIKEIRKTD